MIYELIPEGIYEVTDKPKPFLMYQFPEQKNNISKLSMDQKMEWYGYQFQFNPVNAAVLLSSKEFASFWKWRVLMPMKLKRLFFRLKNGEIFKKYSHITEMKKKIRHYSI